MLTYQTKSQKTRLRQTPLIFFLHFKYIFQLKASDKSTKRTWKIIKSLISFEHWRPFHNFTILMSRNLWGTDTSIDGFCGSEIEKRSAGRIKSIKWCMILVWVRMHIFCAPLVGDSLLPMLVSKIYHELFYSFYLHAAQSGGKLDSCTVSASGLVTSWLGIL